MVRMNCSREARLSSVLVVTGVLIASGIGGGHSPAEAASAAGSTAPQDQPSFQQDPPCYFPLQVGNRWDYLMSHSQGGPLFDSQRPDLVTVRIPTSYWDGDRPYFEIDNFMFPFVDGPSFFFNNAPGQATELMGHDTGVWYPWSSFGSGQRVPITLPPFGEDCIHGSSGIYLGRRTVTVPAGTFADAAVIAYDSFPCADEGLYEEVLAPGVGLIRRSIISRIGVITWSLAHAQVGDQVWGAPWPDIVPAADKTTDSNPGSPAISTTTWGDLKSKFRK